MKKVLYYSCLAAVTALTSCAKQDKENKIITVKNSLNVSRSFETIEILKSDLHLTEGVDFESFMVRDVNTKNVLVSQFVDEDQDGAADVLLFQPELAASSEKQYELFVPETPVELDVEEYCYSRFVPERTDDYAWENNKVAFRAYGPTAQRMIEESTPGGTLSSGIDAWLKKVEYPIINKWYAGNDKDPGFYHIDHGEGLDNFHVGSSRGVGGIAVEKDGEYYLSKNYTDWKTITTGPIRTSFVLNYADWDADGQTISEEKHISLDYGSNFSKFELTVKGTDEISVGLTLHENDGVITEKVEEGYISYWEPHADSELGTSIVAPKGVMQSSDYYVTSMVDRSNLYAKLKVNQNKVVYYAGFAWKKSEQYPTKELWEAYIEDFINKVNHPLEVSIK